MGKKILVFSSLVSCFLLTGIIGVFAQEETVANIEQQAAASEANWKQDLDSDKQQIQAQKQEISQNAKEARAEEDQLKQQIKAAMDSGDMQTARQLREQLRTVHQENL